MSPPPSIDPEAIRAGEERAVRERELRRADPPKPAPVSVIAEPVPEWVQKYGPSPISEARRKVKTRARDLGYAEFELDAWMETPNPLLDGQTPEAFIADGNGDQVLSIVPRREYE